MLDFTDKAFNQVSLAKEGNIRERIEGIIFPEEFDEKVKPMLESSSEKKEIKAK